jgi:hypothetical protein
MHNWQNYIFRHDPKACGKSHSTIEHSFREWGIVPTHSKTEPSNMNTTPIIRVSLTFASRATDNALITFARTVLADLYAAPGFTNIPVSAAVLEAAIDAFAIAKAAQINGGKAATAEKNIRREELCTLLRELAFYVQVTSNNNLAMLLSTGFDSVSNNRARSPLTKPTILRINPGMTGQARVTLSTERTSRGSEVIVAEVGEDGAPGPFRPPVFSTSSRNIVIPNLLPGKLYAFQARNMGGTTSNSDWSDQVVQRAA